MSWSGDDVSFCSGVGCGAIRPDPRAVTRFGQPCSRAGWDRGLAAL